MACNCAEKDTKRYYLNSALSSAGWLSLLREPAVLGQHEYYTHFLCFVNTFFQKTGIIFLKKCAYTVEGIILPCTQCVHIFVL